MNPQPGPSPITNDDEGSLASLYNSLRLPYGSRKVRIIDVLAESSSNANRLDIQLRVIDLANRPRFCALSYAWGSVTAASHNVHCGNNVIGVTPNLWSALWHLRRLYGAALPPLWIDRLCIDQDNEDEKTAQLQLMHHIFSKAQFVYIWLGEGTPASDRGIESLSKIGLQRFLVQDEGGVIVRHGFFVAWKIAFQEIATVHMQMASRLYHFVLTRNWAEARRLHHHNNCAHGLDDVLNRDWSNRIWTLQEILLAHNPILCCGTKTLQWDSLVYSILHIQGSGYVHQDNFPAAGCRRWVGIVSLWIKLAEWRTKETPQLTNIGSPEVQNPLANNTMQYVRLIRAVSRNVSYMGYFCFWSIECLMVLLIMSSALGHLVGIILSSILLILIVYHYKILLQSPFLRTDREEPEDGRLITKSDTTSEAMIREILTRKATNPKDVSIGVHAILTSLRVRSSPPDYSKSLADIHRGLFIDLYNWSKSMNLLLLCDLSRKLPDEPLSWIPNWNIRSEQLWLDPAAFLVDQGGHNPLSFKPSFPISPCFEISKSKTLSVIGVLIDRVSWRCDTFQQTSTVYDAAEEQLHLHNVSTVHALVRKHPIFWESVLLENVYAQPLEKMKMFLQAPNLLPEEKSCFFKWSSIIRRTAEESPASAMDALKAQPTCLSMHIKICNGLSQKSRTLFLTWKRNLLHVCNGPEGSQVGDAVVLVSGVSFPLILREDIQRGTYILVGFIYLVSPPQNIDPDFGYLSDGNRKVWLKCLIGLSRFKILRIY